MRRQRSVLQYEAKSAATAIRISSVHAACVGWWSTSVRSNHATAAAGTDKTAACSTSADAALRRRAVAAGDEVVERSVVWRIRVIRLLCHWDDGMSIGFVGRPVYGGGCM